MCCEQVEKNGVGGSSICLRQSLVLHFFEDLTANLPDHAGIVKCSKGSLQKEQKKHSNANLVSILYSVQCIK